MKLSKNLNILIVGLGLLGGSYARVLKQKGFNVSAITKNQDDIDFALENGIIDNGTTELDAEIIGNADLVIFALYPHIFVEWIEENQSLLKSGANNITHCMKIARITEGTGPIIAPNSSIIGGAI